MIVILTLITLLRTHSIHIHTQHYIHMYTIYVCICTYTQAKDGQAEYGIRIHFDATSAKTGQTSLFPASFPIPNFPTKF